MDCKRIENIILTDYADGKLTSSELKELEAHLASCEGCRKLASRLASISSVLRGTARMEAPPGVWEKIRARTAGEPTQAVLTESFLEKTRAIFARLRPAIVVATASAIILAVLIAGKLMPPRGMLGQDDLFSMISSEDNGSAAVYDLGTQAENYFL